MNSEDYKAGWEAAFKVAIEAANEERLTGNSGYAEDVAYNFAIDDVVDALNYYSTQGAMHNV